MSTHTSGPAANEGQEQLSVDALVALELQDAGDHEGKARPSSAGGKESAAHEALGRTTASEARERWIENPPEPYFGLALSGGGIRSATFNLGVLQGLNERKYLSLFHYLATVSGGGYVGGFWSLWRTYRGDTPVFPDEGINPAVGTENAPIRHLRKFSGFLAPSLGAFSFDTGRMLVALINAVVPSLIGAAAWVGLLLLGSIAIGALVLVLPAWPSARWLSAYPAITSGVAAAMWGVGHLFFMRIAWLKRRTPDGSATAEARAGAPAKGDGSAESTTRTEEGTGAARGSARRIRRMTYAAAVLLMGVAWGLWVKTHADLPHRALAAFVEVQHRHVQNWTPSNVVWQYAMSPALLLLVVASAMTLLVMLGAALAGQTTESGKPGPVRQATDRVSSWLMFAAAAWAILVLLWWVAFFVASNQGVLGAAVRSLSIAGVPLAALIPWLQRFTGGKGTSGERTGERAGRWSLIAIGYVVVAALVVLLMWAIISVHRQDVWWWFFLGLAAALFVAVLYDPNHVGLHHFYRQRIARGFLGAAHAIDNAIDSDTEPQDRDDLPMSRLRKSGPCHLVVCAANDLTPRDALESLGRGARSAVLSPAGYSVGSQCVRWKDDTKGVPTLAAALTASGAAFNTQMGAKSKTLGPAVAFIMSALGLRLGLWLRHPHRLGDGPVVRSGAGGLALLRELLGQSDARNHDHVFLSDGGHFDNTGLYELVRRHCRYIIVSDCGQDTGRNFDDLGNVVRLVREDFNVDIKIDLNPLRPDGNGISRQPMVAGDIHYPNGDTGTLLVLKPTITGAEPPDVQQYRSRNPLFPHQTTGDQFFDEAQWESYRRLGQHIARAAFATETVRHPTLANSSARATTGSFRKLDPATGAEKLSVDDRRRQMARDFGRARREWQPRAIDYAERVDRLTRLMGSLEGMLQQTRGRLMREVMWEIMPGVAGERDRADDNRLSDDLSAVRQALVTFESIFLSENLGTQFNQPIYIGVMNVMARWMRTSLVRTWWPLLSSTCGSAFREFVRAQFDVGAGRRNFSVAWDKGSMGDQVLDLATRQRDLPRVRDAKPGESRSFALEQMHLILTLEDASGSRGDGSRLPSQRIEVARLDLVRSVAATSPARAGGDPGHDARHGSTAQQRAAASADGPRLLMWHAGDLFVPPGLWGLGFGGEVLRQLVPLGDDTARASGATADTNLSGATQGGDEARFRLDHQLVFVQTFRTRTPELKKDSADLQQLYLDAGFSPNIPAHLHADIDRLYRSFYEVCRYHADFLPNPDSLLPPRSAGESPLRHEDEIARRVHALQQHEHMVMLLRPGGAG